MVTFNKKEPIAQGPNSAQIPGMTSIITAPYTAFQGFKSFINARKIKDHETVADSSVQTIAQPVFFGYSFLAIAYYTKTFLVLIIQHAKTKLLIGVAAIINSLGIIACGIQFAFESLNAKRVYYFRSEMNFAVFNELETSAKLLKNARNTPDFKASVERLLKNIQKDDIKNQLLKFMDTAKYNETILTLTQGLKEYKGKKTRNGKKCIGTIQKALKILNEHGRQPFIDDKIAFIWTMIDSSPTTKKHTVASSISITQTEKEANFMRLGRRIQPWLAADLLQNRKTLEMASASSNKDIQQARYNALGRFLEQADQQSMKTLKAHYIGLAALTIAIGSFIAGFFSGGLVPLITALLATTAAIIGTGRYVYSAGYLNSRGNVFRKENLIPVPIRKFYRKATAIHYLAIAIIAVIGTTFVAGFFTGGLTWVITATVFAGSVGVIAARYLYNSGHLDGCLPQKLQHA